MHDRFIAAAIKLIIHSGLVQINAHHCFVISSHVCINGSYVSVIHIAEDDGQWHNLLSVVRADCYLSVSYTHLTLPTKA